MRKIISLFAFAAIVFSFAACGDGNVPESDIVINPNSDYGKMPYAFSVGQNKTVYFSQGNLQYNASSKLWKFANHQWDTLGVDANKQIGKVDYKGWIDLFGWGTAQNPTESTTDNSAYPDPFKDWGDSAIANGNNHKRQWRTLSLAEWKYLFFTRDDAEKLIGLGTVNGVNGLILLPDYWRMPLGVPVFKPSAENGMSKGSDKYRDATDLANHFADNTYSVAEWDVMEKAGAIFLPAAGCRLGKTVNKVGVTGRYWTTTYSTDAYCMDFIKHDISQTYTLRGNGGSVRLVFWD